jgi:uncharacterized protein
MRKRFVFDTNVLFSSILSTSAVSKRAFDKAFERGIILFSQYTFEEVENVFYRPKLQKYIDTELRDEFYALTLKKIHFMEVEKRIVICRDPKDDKFLDIAVQGNADFIITGDDDLLVLNPFRNIQIIQPSELLKIDF